MYFSIVFFSDSMAERKCPYCGSTDFVEINLVEVSGLDVGCTQNVTSMACVKCGHMDIVAKPEIIKKRLDSIKAEQDRKAEIVNLKKQIEEVKAEIKRLKAIIADENQTVKAVKEAKEEINGYENELRNLEGKLKSYNSTWAFW